MKSLLLTHQTTGHSKRTLQFQTTDAVCGNGRVNSEITMPAGGVDYYYLLTDSKFTFAFVADFNGLVSLSTVSPCTEPRTDSQEYIN